MSADAIGTWPAEYEEFWRWQVDAACRQAPSTLFYSPEGERGPSRLRREHAAKQVCAGCGVRELCAAYALANREPYGTWGGLSERERRAAWERLDERQALVTYRAALAAWTARASALREAAAAMAQSTLIARLHRAARRARRS